MRNRQFDGVDPEPIRGRLREPGYVLRFRKERSFIYPLAVREEDERASPTMEAVAQTQAMACGRPRPACVGGGADLPGMQRHAARRHGLPVDLRIMGRVATFVPEHCGDGYRQIRWRRR
ncbi:MAG: hypothetical protein WBP81_19030 [Solirubrobacteraceae bacterium]